MKILGLAGFSHSGKDEAAIQLRGWKRFAFADELKKLAGSMISTFCCLDADWNDPSFKESWRMFLVGLGAGMRSVEPEFWIDTLQDSVGWEKARAREASVVLADCRYWNECLWVYSQGGLVLRIDRPGIGPANPEEARSFAEIEAKYPNMLRIQNDGTPGQLGDRVREAIDKHPWRSA